MAFEDRQNIVKLVVSKFSRLAGTVHSERKILWEKISSLMTDSVVKNLNIENLIAASLASTRIPILRHEHENETNKSLLQFSCKEWAFLKKKFAQVAIFNIFTPWKN